MLLQHPRLFPENPAGRGAFRPQVRLALEAHVGRRGTATGSACKPQNHSQISSRTAPVVAKGAPPTRPGGRGGVCGATSPWDHLTSGPAGRLPAPTGRVLTAETRLRAQWGCPGEGS